VKKSEIHIRWEGPFSYDKVKKEFADEDKDYGVYQLYGTHQIYGFNTLLYIGMVAEQTFSERISQHGHLFDEQALPIVTEVRIGRLIGKTPNDGQEWNERIKQAERLLILAHQP